MVKRIDVQDQAITVLIDLKTEELKKAIVDQSIVLYNLAQSLQKYVDWLEEELVRMEGEK